MRPVRQITISDIHLFHPKVPSPVITANLRRTLFPRIPHVDMIVIGGDVTDTEVNMSHPYTPDLISFYLDLLSICAEFDVTVRVMRGTFSHDRNNLVVFKTYHQKYQFQNSLEYYDTIRLEHIEKFDLRVLYIPDDMPYKTSEAIMDVVQGLMAEKGWDYVDYAYTHGYFEDVLPPISHREKPIVFRRSQFMFVRRYIVSAHVHTHSVHDAQTVEGKRLPPLLYNGSFDRLVHGEEEPKGFLYFDDDGETAKIQFVENENATPFVTLDLRKYRTSEEAVSVFREYAGRWSPNDTVDPNIRVVYDDNDVLKTIGQIAKQEFPYIRYSQKSLQISASKAAIASEARVVAELKPPTPENLPSMIIDFLSSTKKGTTLTQTRIKEILDRIKGK